MKRTDFDPDPIIAEQQAYDNGAADSEDDVNEVTRYPSELRAAYIAGINDANELRP